MLGNNIELQLYCSINDKNCAFDHQSITITAIVNRCNLFLDYENDIFYKATDENVGTLFEETKK